MPIGYLVELDTLVRPREWAAASDIFWDSTTVFFDDASTTFAAGGIYHADLDPGMILVSRVSQDGQALAPVLSVQACVETVGAWFYDGAIQRLWIHTTDGLSPLGKIMLATVVECLGLGVVPATMRRDIAAAAGAGLPTLPPFVVGESEVGGAAVLGGADEGGSGGGEAPTGQDVVYETRIKTLPNITTEIGVSDLGAAASIQFGELTAHNEDGWWDRRIATRILHGQPMRIYRGELAPGLLSALTLWAQPTMDLPTLTPETCQIPLVSLAKALDKPACPTLYSTDAYPALDPAAAGAPIPKIWGRVLGAPCTRIASGRWKLSALRAEEITAVATKDGTAVAILSVDLDQAEFTVDVTHDAESALYADAIGIGVHLPGAMIARLALDCGLRPDQLDLASLATADLDRPVRLGLAVSAGSIRDALARVAESALVDWYVTRDNRLAALARRVDTGNLVVNPAFATDTTEWFTVGLVLTRRLDGGGIPYGELAKPSDAETSAYAAILLLLQSGHRYTVTMLVAADGPEDVSAGRLALADVFGVVAVSEPFVIPARRWARVMVDFLAGAVTVETITFARTDVFWDSAGVTFAAGSGLSALRFYPRYGSGIGVTVALRGVECCETVICDDSNARVREVTVEPTVLARASYRYAHRLRDDSGPFAAVDRVGTAVLFPLAESRQVAAAELEGEADARAVAQATMDYYGDPRLRVSVELLEWDRPLEPGAVLDLRRLSRVPVVTDGSGLARVVKVAEAPSGGGRDAPIIALEAILTAEPVLGQAPLVAA